RRGVEAEGAVSVSDVARPGEDRGAADVTGAEPEDALAGNLGNLAGGEGRDAHPGGDAPALVAATVAGLGCDVRGGGDVGHGSCSSLSAYWGQLRQASRWKVSGLVTGSSAAGVTRAGKAPGAVIQCAGPPERAWMLRTLSLRPRPRMTWP